MTKIGTGTSVVLGGIAGAVAKSTPVGVGSALGLGSLVMILTGNIRKTPAFIISFLASNAVKFRIQNGYWAKFGVNVGGVEVYNKEIK